MCFVKSGKKKMIMNRCILHTFKYVVSCLFFSTQNRIKINHFYNFVGVMTEKKLLNLIKSMFLLYIHVICIKKTIRKDYDFCFVFSRAISFAK